MEWMVELTFKHIRICSYANVLKRCIYVNTPDMDSLEIMIGLHLIALDFIPVKIMGVGEPNENEDSKTGILIL